MSSMVARRASKPDTQAVRQRKKHPSGAPLSAARSKGIDLMLVDDHPMWRDTLRTLLLHSNVGSVVAEAGDGDEALVQAGVASPDLVIMDINLPTIDGIETTRRLIGLYPTTKVLVLSSSDERSQVVDAVRAGASGYLLKTAAPAELVDAVRRIHAGEMVFPPSLATIVLDELRRAQAGESSLVGGLVDQPAKSAALAELTDREQEVLALMAEGHSNQAIAEKLFLGVKTVETHVSRIFMKLGLEPATEIQRRVLAVLAYLRAT